MVGSFEDKLYDYKFRAAARNVALKTDAWNSSYDFATNINHIYKSLQKTWLLCKIYTLILKSFSP